MCFSPGFWRRCRDGGPPSSGEAGSRQQRQHVSTNATVLIQTRGRVSQIKTPVWVWRPGAIGYSVSPPSQGANERAASSSSSPHLIGDSLDCHQSNGATNTAALRDEREGFPKTPGCSIKQERHAGREIERRERAGERGRDEERSPGVVPSSQGSVQVSLEAGRLVS